VLVVVDDPNLLDLLTRVFESRRMSVATAATARQAIASLESGRSFDAVVAAWAASHPVGGEVYRWVLRQNVGMRAHFVFVADDVPAEFDRVVAGRCLSVRPDEIEELVRVVEATVKRTARSEALADHDRDFLTGDRPSLLLADGDPFQLMVMARLLGDVGFRVTSAESGHAAIAQLEEHDFDVIVSEWNMPDGSGAELYRWISITKPWVLDRIVILTGGGVNDPAEVAPGVPVVPKGQDSAALLALLTATAKRTRGAA
jgi:CheY-like chemotaxis protein